MSLFQMLLPSLIYSPKQIDWVKRDTVTSENGLMANYP